MKKDNANSPVELPLKEKILETAALLLCFLVLLGCFIKVVFV